jgi:Zn-dependent protease
MNYFLYGFGFLMLVVAAIRVMAYRRVRALSLRAATYAVATADDVPLGLRVELEQAVTDLLPLGFQARGFARITTVDADDERPQWHALAEHSQYGSWALITASPIPEADMPLLTTFYSLLADGRHLMSAECISHLMISSYPDTIIVDHGEINVSASWNNYRNELLKHGPSTPLADASALMTRLQALTDAYLPMLRQKNMLATAKKTGREQLSVLAAWQFVGRIQRGQAALVRARSHRRRQSVGKRNILVPTAIEADAVIRFEQATDRRSHGGSSPIIFLVSLIAFVVAALLSDGYGSSLAFIVAILLFHEFGHFMAMRICGYRDTSIFFLPLIGAAASGRKADATIPEQVFVSLMGPLPGIILGLIFLACAPSQPPPQSQHLLFQSGLLLVVINLFNLLPIMPFDGGQIVNRLLFGRRPWLDFIFRSVAVVVVLGLGLSMGPILIYVSVFLALGLITQRQIACLRSRIMRSPEIMTLTGEKLTEAVSALVVQDPSYKSKPFALRVIMVREICTAINRPAISLGMSIALLAAYIGSCALAPVAVLIYVMFTRFFIQ